MSDMRSWKSLASSASSRLKGYVVQKDPRTLNAGTDNRQTWKEWAGEKINNRRSPTTPGVEKIALFPGWAARRYESGKGETEEPFELDVYVSGFATLHRSADLASRSQRAFLRLAKTFAALPKLEDEPNTLATPRPSPSTEELLKNIQLPARPEDMTEDSEVAALEKQFQKMNGSIEELSRPPSPSTPRPEPPIGTKISNDLRKFHANFESRLQPFWSSVLPGRTISIQLFPKPLDATEDPTAHGPIASTYVQTAPDGSFQARVRVRWEEMCQHPGALHIAFGQASLEHEVLAQAYLLPTTSPPPSPTDETPPGPPPVTSARIPLTHSPIRVISDIDDTIKHADVLGGARSVFYNVFVRELSDLIIPGMGEWYTKMWNRGVRFHYISNGPFELLPVLGDFLTVARLPPGSIKLKSYAGRSLFSGLLSAPAARKRAAVQDVLDAFPHSRFILVGDTGEQDMELYAEFANQRPKQILAIFVRQADSNNESSIPLEDPTAINAPIRAQVQPGSAPVTYYASETPAGSVHRKRSTASSSNLPTPKPTSTRNDYFGPGAQITTEPEPMSMSLPPINPESSISSRASSSSSSSSSSGYFFSRKEPSRNNSRMSTSEVEEKKLDLQMRVWNARMIIPESVVFRVFRKPEECAEDVEHVLEGNQSV